VRRRIPERHGQQNGLFCTNLRTFAMASRPEQILAKPGMGVAEGCVIVYNEM
jgi:methylaspartate ammonia-lyase